MRLPTISPSRRVQWKESGRNHESSWELECQRKKMFVMKFLFTTTWMQIWQGSRQHILGIVNNFKKFKGCWEWFSKRGSDIDLRGIFHWNSSVFFFQFFSNGWMSVWVISQWLRLPWSHRMEALLWHQCFVDIFYRMRQQEVSKPTCNWRILSWRRKRVRFFLDQPQFVYQLPQHGRLAFISRGPTTVGIFSCGKPDSHGCLSAAVPRGIAVQGGAGAGGARGMGQSPRFFENAASKMSSLVYFALKKMQQGCGFFPAVSGFVWRV